jgi:hypothetical protein
LIEDKTKMAVAKKQNLLARYLTPFGIKQFADL